MRVTSLISLAGCLTALSYASPLPEASPNEIHEKRQGTPSVPCTSGVVVFGVRGSSDNTGTSAIPAIYSALPPEYTTIANAIKGKFNNQGYLQAIAYPASQAGGPNYGASVEAGVASLQDAIYDYINRCSTGRVVVLGYSQGGQVVTGALAGSQTRGPLRAKLRLRAAVMFADPTYVDGKSPVDAGTAANNGRNGVIPNVAGYDFLVKNFGSRARSYCRANDLYCDSGSDGAIHGSAVSDHAKLAQDFILKVVT